MPGNPQLQLHLQCFKQGTTLNDCNELDQNLLDSSNSSFRFVFSLSKQTIILLQNCEEGSYLDLARIYELTNSKSAIAIRNSAEISLYLNYSAREIMLFQMRQVHLIVENVVKVTIHEKTFDQVVVNAVFRNIKNLNLREKSFGSCWGAVWLFNVPDMKPMMANAFSSSDMVVYRDSLSATDNPFTTHARPELTPLQKFNQVYHISAKVADLGLYFYF